MCCSQLLSIWNNSEGGNLTILDASMDFDQGGQFNPQKDLMCSKFFFVHFINDTFQTDLDVKKMMAKFGSTILETDFVVGRIRKLHLGLADHRPY